MHPSISLQSSPTTISKKFKLGPTLSTFVLTDAHKSSYFIGFSKHWNALPDEIVMAQTLLNFKNHLHRFLYLHSVATVCKF